MHHVDFRGGCEECVACAVVSEVGDDVEFLRLLGRHRALLPRCRRDIRHAPVHHADGDGAEVFVKLRCESGGDDAAFESEVGADYLNEDAVRGAGIPSLDVSPHLNGHAFDVCSHVPDVWEGFAVVRVSERVKQSVLHDADGVLGDCTALVLLRGEVPDVLERVCVGRGGGARTFDALEEFCVSIFRFCNLRL